MVKLRLKQVSKFRRAIRTLTSRQWIILLILLSLTALSQLAGASQSNSQIVNQLPNPLNEVQIVSETIVGQPGYFRVGQSTKGRWWFLDSEGKPFFHKGVNSVGDGRGIVPTTSPLSAYTEIFKQKYGQDTARFRQVTLEQLRSWNFNALGAWTASDFWDQDMPYAIVLDFVKVDSAIRSYGLKIPDVFDPKWPQEIDAKVKETVAPRRNSKLLIGYFLDNELTWGDLKQFNGNIQPVGSFIANTRPSLLQVCLSLEKNRPAYQAAWDFVLKRHGNSLGQLAQDWQVRETPPYNDGASSDFVKIESQDKLKQWTQAKQTLVSPRFLKDHREFLHLFAQRYFQISAQAIRRYDQNHLLLGCRFGGPPSLAILSALKRPWVDVVSANNYRYEMYERMDIYYQATHLPLLITEFSWGHDVFSQRPLPNEPKGGFSAPERMIRNGEQSLARVLTHPGIVGYTWYRWINRPKGEPPISVGLITIKDEPNRWHTDLLTQLNAKAEAIATTDFGYGDQIKEKAWNQLKD